MSETNQQRDPRLLPNAVCRLGMPALVASAIALRGDRWGLPDAEHFLDECGEGARQPSESAASDVRGIRRTPQPKLEQLIRSSGTSGKKRSG